MTTLLTASQCAKLEFQPNKQSKVVDMNNTLISIDLAKNVFQVCVMNKDQEIVTNKKVKRPQLLDFLRQYEACTVVMEACYSSNPWGRKIKALGAYSAVPSQTICCR